jgi:hypothetical protein
MWLIHQLRLVVLLNSRVFFTLSVTIEILLPKDFGNEENVVQILGVGKAPSNCDCSWVRMYRPMVILLSAKSVFASMGAEHDTSSLLSLSINSPLI